MMRTSRREPPSTPLGESKVCSIIRDLITWRVAHQVSQSSVAYTLGKDASSIVLFEQGKRRPSPALALAIARMIGMNEDEQRGAIIQHMREDPDLAACAELLDQPIVPNAKKKEHPMVAGWMRLDGPSQRFVLEAIRLLGRPLVTLIPTNDNLPDQLDKMTDYQS